MICNALALPIASAIHCTRSMHNLIYGTLLNPISWGLGRQRSFSLWRIVNRFKISFFRIQPRLHPSLDLGSKGQIGWHIHRHRSRNRPLFAMWYWIDRFRPSALMGDFERARSQRVHRISKPNQHSSGEASSVEHGYNLLLANGIDSIDLQGHYKWSINMVIARRARFFDFSAEMNFEQVILARPA